MNLIDITFIVLGLMLTLATALLVPIVFAGVGIRLGAAWHRTWSRPCR